MWNLVKLQRFFLKALFKKKKSLTEDLFKFVFLLLTTWSSKTRSLAA